MLHFANQLGNTVQERIEIYAQNCGYISEYLRLDGYDWYMIEDGLRASNLRSGILYGGRAPRCALCQ